MASDAPPQLHETKVTRATVEMHRAIRSLIEELEAIDWYAQRIDASDDAELRSVLAHNMNEEKEHACMMLEWIRRHDARMDALLREYLFRPASAPIATDPGAEKPERAPRPTLRIGSLREEAAR